MRHTLQLILPIEAELEDLLKWSVADPSGPRNPSRGSILTASSGSISTLNLLRASCNGISRAVVNEIYNCKELNYSEHLKERVVMRTFEKWYSFGNDISIDKFPSSDEMASIVIGTVSAVGRLLRRLKDLDFGLGGWNPLSSKVQSSLVFKSKYRIRLLFVSAMNSLPVKRINCISKTELISNLFHFKTR
jgi:hypothetical protein